MRVPRLGAWLAGCLLGFGVFSAEVATSAASVATPTESDLRTRAQSGDALAMALLGKRYFRGEEGVTQNYSQAAYWFRQAAEAGSAEGMFNYGVCLHRGLGVEIDLRGALRQYRSASDLGLLPARLMEAEIYQSGIPASPDSGEIPPDPQRAQTTLEALAQAGYAPGMRELGRMLLPEDEVKGFEWLRQAARDGDPTAMRLAAGLLLQGSDKIAAAPEEAVRWLRLAAEAGELSATAQLAFCLEYGVGAAPDRAEAIRLYRLAADAGNPGAQLKIGEYYLNGNPPEQESDPAKAIEYFRKAAQADHPAALFRMGICYLEGFGVEADVRVAADYFLAAANGGDVRSQYNLACLYLAGNGIPEDPKAAFYWFRRAAQSGNVQAQRQLAFCFFEGIGTEADDKTGLFWLREAAKAGDPEALALLEGDESVSATPRSNEQ